MLYLIQHTTIELLFFTFPIVGYFLSKLPKKVLLYSLYTTIGLLLPFVLGYYFIIPLTGSVLLYTALSCCYALTTKKLNFKWDKSIVHTMIAFFIFGSISLLGKMSGEISTEHVWKIKNYKIEYLRERGFSGGPQFTYELSRYTKIPIFITHVDTATDSVSNNGCLIHFTNENFTFNKCDADANLPSITIDTVNKKITITSAQSKMRR